MVNASGVGCTGSEVVLFDECESITVELFASAGFGDGSVDFFVVVDVVLKHHEFIVVIVLFPPYNVAVAVSGGFVG